MKAINILEKFKEVKDYWHPAVLAELNGQHVKLAKIKGEFVMHHHDEEDELFMVIKGSFDMVYEDATVTLNEGDMVVVPKGVKHKPVAKEEAWILLFEPASTVNTGNLWNERTKENLHRI